MTSIINKNKYACKSMYSHKIKLTIQSFDNLNLFCVGGCALLLLTLFQYLILKYYNLQYLHINYC